MISTLHSLFDGKNAADGWADHIGKDVASARKRLARTHTIRNVAIY